MVGMYSRIVDLDDDIYLAIGRGVFEVIKAGNQIHAATVMDAIEGFIERQTGSEHAVAMADDALDLIAYLSSKAWSSFHDFFDINNPAGTGS
jgi:hypothetical protein